MPVDPQQLAAVPLFAGFSADQLAHVAAQARQRSYRAEEAIVHQDDPGETLYVILNGSVKISTTDPDGNEVFLAVMAAGENFGELSLIDSKFRSADVVTLEPSTLAALDRPMFDSLVETAPIFSRNLMAILATRNRRANLRIQAHCTLDVFGLVARQVVEFAELYGRAQPDGTVLIPFRLTQSDIADLVGASRERVNQVMRFFREKHFISVDAGRRITVLALAELRKRCR